MAVVVTIIDFPEGMELSQTSMVFDENGGTLGRSSECTWVLSDPERFMSGCHCEILCDQGQWCLIDKSTNGTFLNNSGEPIGKGERVSLSAGDIFEISDYRFQVSFSNESSQEPSSYPPPISSSFDLDDPFAPPVNDVGNSAFDSSASPYENDKFASDGYSSTGLQSNIFTDSEHLCDEETDPLAALDNASAQDRNTGNNLLVEDSFNNGETIDEFGRNSIADSSQSDVFTSNSYSDHASATEQSVSWPSDLSNTELIPDDWDDNDLAETSNFAKSESFVIDAPPEPNKAEPELLPDEKDTNRISLSESEARRRALEKAYKKLKAENASLQKQVEVRKNRSNGSVDRTLVDAIGFEDKELSENKILEISEVSGVFIRKVVEGMMQTLASRNNVKNAFRMNMTTIQPKENNPLKFSANVDDALENMFLKEGDSYKKPLETVDESFESIADHQVAILAGVRSAFKGIAERFSPKELQSVLRVEANKGLIPKNEKALLWEAFCSYYEEQFADLDSSFQTMFGDDFTLAYEAQLQKLALNRRDKG